MKSSAFPPGILALLLVGGFALEAREVVTNDSVLRMHGAGLGASVIIAKIETSETQFDTSVDALVALSKAGVPSDVITSMTRRSGEANGGGGNAPTTRTQEPPDQAQDNRLVVSHTAAAAPTVATNFEGTPCPDSGIFFDAGEELKEIEPSSYSGSKTAGMGKKFIPIAGRFFSIKSKAMINGITSNNRLGDQSPSFYFCFEETESGLSYETTGSTGPSQFLLVVLDVNPDQRARLVVTGKLNEFTGGYAGPPPNYRVDFTFEKLAPGVYKVSVGALNPGEYAFFYTGSASGTMANTYGLVTPQGGGKVFDFSVG